VVHLADDPYRTYWDLDPATGAVLRQQPDPR
jgi:hypothetical protein